MNKIILYGLTFGTLFILVALSAFLIHYIKIDREDRIVRKEIKNKLAKLKEDVRTVDYFKEQKIITEAQYQNELSNIVHQIIMIENELSYFCNEEVNNEEEQR